MTTGLGAEAIGGWFGTGPDRGIALVFVLTGIIGLLYHCPGALQPALPGAERAVRQTGWNWRPPAS